MTTGACVVDTNVPIVANGANERVTYECRFRTVEFLEKLMSSGRLIIDVEGGVEAEYWSNLKTGYPGVGNRFLQHFFTAHSNRVDRVSIGELTATGYDAITFTGSLKNFDRGDRKFAALSVVTGRPVVVSVDSDWAIAHDELKAAGVKIEFLCGRNQKGWFLQSDT